MSEYENDLLVALDGSGRSMETIKYLCLFTPLQNFGVVLFNVMNRVPESYYDLRSETCSREALSKMRAWENGRKTLMKNFMERSRKKLIAAGFKPEQIRILISARKNGVARDILNEARKGYHALVLRRRGWANAVLPLALGSVSTKVMGSCLDVPVILAGIRPLTHALFVGVDNSPGSLNAVKFVAGIAGNTKCRIVLGSVVRHSRDLAEYQEFAGDMVLPGSPQGGLDKIQNTARDILVRAGVAGDRILVKTVEGGSSRSSTLVEMAMAEGCGTMVLGRRGNSNVPEFNMGRVPWKVVHGARKMTVWVVP